MKSAMVGWVNTPPLPEANAEFDWPFAGETVSDAASSECHWAKGAMSLPGGTYHFFLAGSQRAPSAFAASF